MEINHWNFRAFAIYDIKPRKVELFVTNLKCSTVSESGKIVKHSPETHSYTGCKSHMFITFPTLLPFTLLVLYNSQLN